MVEKSACLQVIPQQSTQNTANLSLQTYEKSRWTFFCCSTRASTLVSAITLLTQVPLQKFPFLFIIIIPWWALHSFGEFMHDNRGWRTSKQVMSFVYLRSRLKVDKGLLDSRRLNTRRCQGIIMMDWTALMLKSCSVLLMPYRPLSVFYRPMAVRSCTHQPPITQ